MATLIVRREKRTLGFALSFPVFVDGESLGNLKNGQSLTCSLTPGKHTVLIKSFEKNIEQGIVVTEEHKTVEIVTSLKMGIVAGRVVLKEINFK